MNNIQFQDESLSPKVQTQLYSNSYEISRLFLTTYCDFFSHRKFLNDDLFEKSFEFQWCDVYMCWSRTASTRPTEIRDPKIPYPTPSFYSSFSFSATLVSRSSNSFLNEVNSSYILVKLISRRKHDANRIRRNDPMRILVIICSSSIRFAYIYQYIGEREHHDECEPGSCPFESAKTYAAFFSS